VNDESAPFEDFPDSVLDAKGNVLFEGQVIGKLLEGDPKQLEGKKVCDISYVYRRLDILTLNARSTQTAKFSTSMEIS
jgi:hypothetical protein